MLWSVADGKHEANQAILQKLGLDVSIDPTTNQLVATVSQIGRPPELMPCIPNIAEGSSSFLSTSSRAYVTEFLAVGQGQNAEFLLARGFQDPLQDCEISDISCHKYKNNSTTVLVAIRSDDADIPIRLTWIPSSKLSEPTAELRLPLLQKTSFSGFIKRSRPRSRLFALHFRTRVACCYRQNVQSGCGRERPKRVDSK